MASAGEQLDQEFLPLAVELGGKDADPCCVAAGVGHRAHQSGPNHVVGKPEDWNRRGGPLGGTNCRISASQNDIDPSVDQLHSNFRELAGAQSVSAWIDRQVLALGEAPPPQLLEQSNLRRLTRIVVQAAETIGSPRLLPVQLQWPSQNCTGRDRNEFAPIYHSMTSLARSRIACGIVSPSAFAVFRFRISSNVAGCSIGKSAGSVPRNSAASMRGKDARAVRGKAAIPRHLLRRLVHGRQANGCRALEDDPPVGEEKRR